MKKERKRRGEERQKREVQIWRKERRAKKAAASCESVPGGGTLGMAGGTGRIRCRKLFRPGCIQLHRPFKSELGG